VIELWPIRSMIALGWAPSAIRMSTPQRVVRLLSFVTASSEPPLTPFSHRVTDRRSGRVVYEVTTDNDVSYREARRSILQDLASLTCEEFDDKYSVSQA